MPLAVVPLHVSLMPPELRREACRLVAGVDHEHRQRRDLIGGETDRGGVGNPLGEPLLKLETSELRPLQGLLI